MITNSRMNTLNKIILGGLAIALALAQDAGAAGSVRLRSRAITHVMVQNQLVPSDLSSNTVGTMRLQFDERGEAIKQTLNLRFAGLQTNSQMGLTTVLGDDPNTIHVLNTTTDSNGRAQFNFVSQAPRQPVLRGSREALPEILSPLCDVRAICIEDSSGQVIGYAWNWNASNFKFISKRNLTPADPLGTAEGTMSLTANPRRATFRLVAAGLPPDSDFNLALNSTVVDTVTSNKRGRLQITGWPTNSIGVLDLRSLALIDSAGNPVLTTTLPR
jgi:hypothetical protein